jgi:hypothetical protein
MSLSTSGNPWAQGSFSPYGTLWSNYFNGTNSELTCTGSALSGQFTMEGWVYYSTSSFANATTYFGISSDNGGFLRQETSSSITFLRAGVSIDVTGSFTPVAGTWYHLAVTRNASNLTTIWVNGVSVGSATSTYSYASGTFAIGANHYSGGTTGWFPGYISNVRLVTGSCLYTTTFTPSTTPLTAVSGTQILTCQSNRFKDNSSNNYTLTVNGSPQVQRFSPFNPTATYSTSVIGGSLYSQGACELDTSYAGTVGSGDNFTAEGWIYLTRVQDNMALFITNGGLSVMQGASGNQISSYDGSFHNWGYTPKLYEWHYYTIQRSGGTAYVWVDGVYLTSFSYSGNWTWSGTRIIGQTANRENGYFSNFRFSSTTRYTNATNFTPPTAPFTTDGSTTLLIAGANAGIPDLAMQNNLQTVGSAQVNTSVKKYGTGSLSFGNSNYLNYPTNNTFLFGTADFTIEFWMYPTDINTSLQSLFSFRNPTVNNFEVRMDNPGQLQVHFGGSLVFNASTNISSNNTWNYVALCRSNGTLRLYLNGTSVGSTSTTYNANQVATTPTIGGAGAAGNWWYYGYIDDFRVTSGYARYSGSTMTVPTAALPTY